MVKFLECSLKEQNRLYNFHTNRKNWIREKIIESQRRQELGEGSS